MMLQSLLDDNEQGWANNVAILRICSAVSTYLFFRYIMKLINGTSIGSIFFFFMETSGQDGSVGRHTVPPHTIKRRTTTI